MIWKTVECLHLFDTRAFIVKFWSSETSIVVGEMSIGFFRFGANYKESSLRHFDFDVATRTACVHWIDLSPRKDDLKPLEQSARATTQQ
jgi:hypothetical protein